MHDQHQLEPNAFKHLFVTEVPPLPHLEPDTIYVSIRYATTVHLCACGCGHEVVNPLSPTDWQLKFDGETVTLDPSINNSSLACKSHYWIDHDRIWWSRTIAAERVAALRAADHRAKSSYYEHTSAAEPGATATNAAAPQRTPRFRFRFWRRHQPPSSRN